MDNETIYKTAGLGISFCVAIFVVLRYFLDLSINSKNKHREDYKFAKEFYADKENAKPIQPYLLEKGYMAIAGNTNLKQHEVEYLLKFTGAATALRQYASGKKYLKELSLTGSLKVEFKDRYKNSSYRYLLEKFYLMLYFVFGILAVLPIFLSLSIFKNYSIYIGIAAILSLLFIPTAIMFAIMSVQVAFAGELVRNQKTHIEQINFPEISK